MQVHSAEEPTGPSKLQKEFDRCLRRAANASAEWRQQSRIFYRAYSGDPWPEGAREDMEEENRPVANFNYALSQINAVLGQDIADRKEARFEGIGYEPSDSFAGECLTALVRSLYMKCRGNREETEAFQDQLVTGYGWCEGFLNTRRFPIWPALSSVDCAEMYWDPDAKKNNLADARYVIRRKKWSLEDAEAKWPKKKAQLRKLCRAGNPSENPFPKRAAFDGYQTKGESAVDNPELSEESLYVYDWQYKKLEKWMIFRDPRDGRRKKLPAKDFKAEQEAIFAEIDPATQEQDPETGEMVGGTPYARVDAAELELEQVFRCYMAGKESGVGVVLQNPERLETEMFTYRCATGYRAKTETGKVRFFGLMSVIFEPQLWTAKALSSAIEHMARSPKGGGGFINSDILEDSADFLDKGSKMGHWSLTKPGSDIKANVFERQTPQFPQAYERLFDIAENAMGRLTTITDYFKGTANQERSNVLVTNLQGQTMMVLNPLIDPLSQMRVENAQLIARLAQQHIAPEDFNRLVGQMEAEDVTYTIAKDPNTGMTIWQDQEPVKVPIPLSDPATGEPLMDEATGEPVPTTPWDVCSDVDIFEYDVSVDLGPASVTAKQAIWQNWQQTAFAQKLLEIYPEVGREIVPWLIKNQPGLSTDEAQRIEKSVRSLLRQSQTAGTLQGIMESLQQLPPEAVAQVAQAAAQLTMQTQPPPPGAGAPQPAVQ